MKNVNFEHFIQLSHLVYHNVNNITTISNCNPYFHYYMNRPSGEEINLNEACLPEGTNTLETVEQKLQHYNTVSNQFDNMFHLFIGVLRPSFMSLDGNKWLQVLIYGIFPYHMCITLHAFSLIAHWSFTLEV